MLALVELVASVVLAVLDSTVDGSTVRSVGGGDASKTSTDCSSATDSYAKAASLADTREISIKRSSRTGAAGFAAEAELAASKMLVTANNKEMQWIDGIIFVKGIYLCFNDWL